MLNQQELERKKVESEKFIKNFNPKEQFVPPKYWGKDHFSTFGYVEVRCVDHKGHIQPQNMRCNPRLHQRYAHVEDGGKYPTRLAGGAELFHHDDWSCVEDFTAFGLIRIVSDTAKPKRLVGLAAVWLREVVDLRTAILKLTPLGMRVAAALRAHKQTRGGSFGNFQCPAALLGEMMEYYEQQQRAA